MTPKGLSMYATRLKTKLVKVKARVEIDKRIEQVAEVIATADAIIHGCIIGSFIYCPGYDENLISRVLMLE